MLEQSLLNYPVSAVSGNAQQPPASSADFIPHCRMIVGTDSTPARSCHLPQGFILGKPGISKPHRSRRWGQPFGRRFIAFSPFPNDLAGAAMVWTEWIANQQQPPLARSKPPDGIEPGNFVPAVFW